MFIWPQLVLAASWVRVLVTSSSEPVCLGTGLVLCSLGLNPNLVTTGLFSGDWGHALLFSYMNKGNIVLTMSWSRPRLCRKLPTLRWSALFSTCSSSRLSAHPSPLYECGVLGVPPTAPGVSTASRLLQHTRQCTFMSCIRQYISTTCNNISLTTYFESMMSIVTDKHKCTTPIFTTLHIW